MSGRGVGGQFALVLVAGAMVGGAPVLAAESSDPPPAPFAGEPAAVWAAAGYAGFVQHVCRRWDLNRDALARAGANPTPENFGVDADWGENGRFSLALRAGASEAERDLRADAGFCLRPLELKRGRNPYLGAFLQLKGPAE